MKGRTHLAFAVLLGILISPYVSNHKILFWSLLIISSIIPDIDMPGSWLSIFGISHILKWVTGHRGILHSVFLPAAASISLVIFGFPYLALSVMLGYLSHLILDAFTYSGVQPFAPFGLKIKGFAKTGGLTDWFLFISFLLGIVFLSF